MKPLSLVAAVGWVIAAVLHLMNLGRIVFFGNLPVDSDMLIELLPQLGYTFAYLATAAWFVLYAGRGT